MSKENYSNEQLVIRIKAGIDVADNMLQLWQQNQGFIVKIAMKYRAYEDIEDLKQEGYFGLCRAVDGYNPDEGVTFIHYAAFWIRQSMQRYMENCCSVVRIPTHARARVGKYKRFCMEFEKYYGRKPSDWEICRSLGIDEDMLASIKESTQMAQIGSLDKLHGICSTEYGLSQLAWVNEWSVRNKIANVRNAPKQTRIRQNIAETPFMDVPQNLGLQGSRTTRMLYIGVFSKRNECCKRAGFQIKPMLYIAYLQNKQICNAAFSNRRM